MSIQNIKKLLHVQCIRMGNGDKIIVRRRTVFFFLHVCSGEQRLRRSSANILGPSSDEKSLAGGAAESYRRPPAWGSSPELATAPADFLRSAAADRILMPNKKTAAISFRDSHCLHLSRSIKRVLNRKHHYRFATCCRPQMR